MAPFLTTARACLTAKFWLQFNPYSGALTIMPKYKLATRPAAIVKAEPATLAQYTEAQAIVKAEEIGQGFESSMKGALDLLKKYPKPGMAGHVFDLFRKWKKNLEDVQEQARLTLLSYVENNGEDDPEKERTKLAEVKLGQRTIRLKRQVHKHTEPDHMLLKALLKTEEAKRGLAALGLKEKDVWVQTIVEKVNMDALDRLVEIGAITPDDVEECRKVKSTNLTVEG